MTIDEYILTYKVDDKIVANLFDYYERYIRNLEDRFKPYSYYEDKLVLCYFKDHEDLNPSMGYIQDRNHKGVYLYHCFGCGKTGDVIRLNQLIEEQYHGRRLDRKESAFDLAEKFGIDISEFDTAEEEDLEKAYLKKLKKIKSLQDRYTEKDFAKALLNLRQSGKVDLAKVNSECVKLIATKKMLYS